MSEDNEYANGNGNRFVGLDELFKQGGKPNQVDEQFKGAYLAIRDWLQPISGNPGDLGAQDLIREMHKLRTIKDAADLIAKQLGARYDYLRLAAVPAAFESEGLRNIKLEGIGRVSLRGDIYAAIQPGQKSEAYQWLDDNGRGDLIQSTVNASTLKATLKKMLESGEEIPENLFRVTPFTMATITKA